MIRRLLDSEGSMKPAWPRGSDSSSGFRPASFGGLCVRVARSLLGRGLGGGVRLGSLGHRCWACPAQFNFSLFSPSTCANDILQCNYSELNLGCAERQLEILWVTVSPQLAVIRLSFSRHGVWWEEVEGGGGERSIRGGGRSESSAPAKFAWYPCLKGIAQSVSGKNPAYSRADTLFCRVWN